VKSAHHLYVIQVPREHRDRMLNDIQAHGVGVAVHFRALHFHSFYRKTTGYKRGAFPVAERASDRVISLPLYPRMTDDDVRRVVRAVALAAQGRPG
jgi:dTDP-4-amino-4,6-dideoxygalactose transaminase